MSRDIGNVTWRRFLALLRGLSMQSATVAIISRSSGVGSRSGEAAVTTPEAADRAFVSIFGPRSKVESLVE